MSRNRLGCGNELQARRRSSQKRTLAPLRHEPLPAFAILSKLSQSIATRQFTGKHMTTIPGLSHNGSLLLFTLIAVVGLVLFVAKFKLNSFLALILASLFVGLCSGTGLTEIAKSFEKGVGDVLGSIAVVIAL